MTLPAMLIVTIALTVLALVAAGTAARVLAAGPSGFDRSVTVNGLTIRVTAEEGVLPADATLSVSLLTGEEKERVIDALGGANGGGASSSGYYDDRAAFSRHYLDIKVIGPDGSEVQPADGKKVNISYFSSGPAAYFTETKVFHFSEETDGSLSASELQVTKTGGASTVETGSFSYFFFEFDYYDDASGDTHTYILRADETVALNDLARVLGIPGTEVTNAVFNASQNFAVFRDADDENKWKITALQAFLNTETLKLTMDGTTDYTVRFSAIDNTATSGVTRSGDKNTFFSNAPIATLFLQKDKLALRYFKGSGTATNDGVELIMIDDHGGVFDYTTGEAIRYNGQINVEQPNVLAGECFAFKYVDAAKTNSGENLDVIYTYSDITLYAPPENNPYNYYGRTEGGFYAENIEYPTNGIIDTAHVWLVNGNEMSARTTAEVHLGITAMVNIRIVDKSGNDVPGRFNFGVSDIDVVRNNSSNYESILNSAENNAFSEQIQIVNGAVSNAIIPEYSISKIDRVEYGTYANGLLFQPTASVNNPDPDFKAGFVLQADSAAGLTLKVTTNAGNRNQGAINSTLYSPINTHRVEYKTGPGGSIQTTTSGNPEGDLSTGTPFDSADDSVIYVPHNKDVTFTMKCEVGREIASFKVNGVDVTDQVELMRDLEYLGQPDVGHIYYYTYTINNVTSDYLVEVEWTTFMRISRFEAKDANGSDGNPHQDFWYRVEGDGKVIDVCIPAGQNHVDVGRVKPGVQYTVTEKKDWSWRYDPVSVDVANSGNGTNVTGSGNVATITIVEGRENNRVIFTGVRNDREWLNGSDSRENIFTRITTDPVTQENWKKYLYDSTENTGLVWVDKSVTAEASSSIGGHWYSPVTINKTDGADFLLDFSLMSSMVIEHSVTPGKMKPLDIVLVLDRSGSMVQGYGQPATGEYYVKKGPDASNYKNLYNDRSGAYYKDGENYYKLNVTRRVDRSEYYSRYYYTVKYTGPSGEITLSNDVYGGSSQSGSGNVKLGFPYYIRKYGSYYEHTREEALREALQSFVELIINNADSSGANHRVALVGFGNNENGSTPYNGTGVYYNGSNFYKMNESTYNTAVSNGRAFFAASNSTGQTRLRAAVAAYAHAEPAETYIDKGLEIAKRIIENDNINSDERKRIVIVFTDGVPGTFPNDATTWGNAAYGQANDQEAVAQKALNVAAEIKNNAEIFTIGIFDGADSTSAGSSTGNNLQERANHFMQALSSNDGDAQHSPKYYLTTDETNNLTDIFDLIEQTITESMYEEGSPVQQTVGGSTDFGYITYTDPLGEYMEIADINAIIFHGDKNGENDEEKGIYRRLYSKTSAPGAGGTTVDTYVFQGQVVSDLTGEEAGLNEITIKVTKSGRLKDGDVLEVKVPASLIPMRVYHVDSTVNSATNQTEYTMTIDRDRPMHVFYSVKRKDRIKDVCEGRENLTGNELTDWISYMEEHYDTNGRMIRFHSNEYNDQLAGVSGGDSSALGLESGNATVSFVPSTNNHFYYFINDSPLFAENHSLASDPDINNIDLNRFHYHIYHYDFDKTDPEYIADLASETGLISGKTYKAVMYVDTAEAKHDCVVDGKNVIEKSDLKWRKTGEHTDPESGATVEEGYWYIPAGTQKKTHIYGVNRDKMLNVSDTAIRQNTATMVYHDEDPANPYYESVRYLGNNGTIYAARLY